MNIAFVTCAPKKLAYYFPTRAEPQLIVTEPPFTPDDQLVVNDLRANDDEVSAIIWREPINRLKKFDLIVIRSCWDYMDNEHNRKDFIQWINALSQAGMRVLNSPRLMQWLFDKHYLEDFHRQGVAVIPTKYIPKKTPLNLTTIFHQQGPFVLKPCISAAGMGLFYIPDETTAIQYQEEMGRRLQHADYMLQTFIPEINCTGEWSLSFIAGEYSHTIHKKPAVNEIMVHAERGGSLSLNIQPPMHILQFAKAVYEKMFAAFHSAKLLFLSAEEVLYLRLDIIDTNKGPLLIECEGVEPELFFRADLTSAKRFVHAIHRLAKSNSNPC